MKKFVTLILILLASWTVSLGQDTKNITTNKDTIHLPKVVGRAVAADLIRGDSMRSELVIKNDVIALQKTNLNLKDQIIASKQYEIDTLKLVIKNHEKIESYKDTQITNQTNTINTLNKELKKEKRKRIFKDIVGGTGILVLGYFLLK